MDSNSRRTMARQKLKLKELTKTVNKSRSPMFTHTMKTTTRIPKLTKQLIKKMMGQDLSILQLIMGINN